jgi:hypothetical protein
MPTCDFCHRDQPFGKRYTLYSTWYGDPTTANFVIAPAPDGSWTNFVKHEFFVCHACAVKRWAVVLGVSFAVSLAIAWVMSFGFPSNQLRAELWTFGIALALLLVLVGSLFLNFGRKFKARLKKGNPFAEVYSENDYRAMTKVKG